MTPATSATAVEEQAPSTAPRITKVWRDVITHPAGASGEVAIVHVYFDWSDGAQTCRCRPDGAWLCVHPGADWPDAVTECKHIYALGAE